MTIKLSNKQARAVILHLQGLTASPRKKLNQQSLLEMIEQLGFVQLDSIRWMERAHHMILFSRNQTYHPQMLDMLQRASQVFENWSHDSSVIPIKYWPYWKHKFEREAVRLHKKFTDWQGAGFDKRQNTLLERVETQGVIKARDIEKPKGQKLEMWQWHDGKAALEYLWRTGQLCVPYREGFQKAYDLCERVVPQDMREKTCSYEDFVDWACTSALARLGFGSLSDIAHFWDLLSIKEVREWYERVGKDKSILVDVEGHDKSTVEGLIARQDILDVVECIDKLPTRMRLMSPFDPVIRDRKRLSWLFGFDYTIEIYVPASKRKYGYYVYPLLLKDKLIGRIDCRANRKVNRLEVNKVWLEPKARWSAASEDKLKAELERQAKFCEVESIHFAKDYLVGG